MASGDIQSFFRQKKKGAASGIAKRKAPSPPLRKTTRGRCTASLAGPDPVQPPALISHGSLDLKEDYSAAEERLRQFDMDMRYGPCLGISRMDRWERACGLGLDPSHEVEAILRSSGGGMECLWEGRV